MCRCKALREENKHMRLVIQLAIGKLSAFPAESGVGHNCEAKALRKQKLAVIDMLSRGLGKFDTG